MPLPWQHTFCHCPKMCPTHLHFKANMCAKFNLKMLFPLNCWHMLLPWQHIFSILKKVYCTSIPQGQRVNPKFFFWIACEMFCFSVFGIIRCYHGNAHPATVSKCVMHSYTSTWTCMPNFIWNAFPPQFLAYAVTMATHFLPLSKKCVLHIYTPTQTSVPTFMRIGEKLRK